MKRSSENKLRQRMLAIILTTTTATMLEQPCLSIFFFYKTQLVSKITPSEKRYVKWFEEYLSCKPYEGREKVLRTEGSKHYTTRKEKSGVEKVHCSYWFHYCAVTNPLRLTTTHRQAKRGIKAPPAAIPPIAAGGRLEPLRPSDRRVLS